jgi:hypothetical protein
MAATVVAVEEADSTAAVGEEVFTAVVEAEAITAAVGAGLAIVGVEAIEVAVRSEVRDLSAEDVLTRAADFAADLLVADRLTADQCRGTTERVTEQTEDSPADSVDRVA